MSVDKTPRWHEACQTSEMDGEEMLECHVDGQDLLLVRFEDRLVACPARCPHMDEPLAFGMVDGCVLTCSKHLWQWNLDTGAPEGPAEMPLAVAPVRIEGSRVMVNLAAFDSATPGGGS
jgi:toluene monooxygenase system ferredoxin subunit